MPGISIEIGQTEYEALKKRYPDLTVEQAVEMLIKRGLQKRMRLMLRRARVTQLHQPNKG